MTTRLDNKFNKEIEKLRADIPAQYNKVLTLDYLLKPEIDMLVSITTRGDGKSYQYFYVLLKLAMKFKEFKLCIIARHYTLRNAYGQLIEQIFNDNGVQMKDFVLRRTDFYIQVYYKNEQIALITDLGAATDLKYHSAVLRHFRMIVYDEFLALDGDYLPDEPDRLKTIYESIDRGENELLPNPKLLLIGNPVNFNSPLLAYWDMFNYLETQKMNTVKQFGNIVIERFRNDHINEQKNARLFNKKDNSSVTGEFKQNTALVVKSAMKHTYNYQFSIMLDNSYHLTVSYYDTSNYYLSVNSTQIDDYMYTIPMLQYKQDVRILADWDFNESFEWQYIDHKILFADTFTIDYFDKHPRLKQLDITNLINEHYSKLPPDKRRRDDEEIAREKQIENSKRIIKNQYFENSF